MKQLVAANFEHCTQRGGLSSALGIRFDCGTIVVDSQRRIGKGEGRGKGDS